MARLSLADARALWILTQGLDAPAGAPLVATLARTGFVRTLGGVDAYLAAAARVPGMTPADLEAAVARAELQIVPAVRGCIYLVAAADAPVALGLAHVLAAPRDARERVKAGIRPGELEKLAGEVRPVLLAEGPLTTDAIRKALPAGAVRSLGERGKKAGVASPLPGALRELEFAGVIERVLAGERLDSERYVWRMAGARGVARMQAPREPAELVARLAAVYWRAAGLGRVRDFADWCGVGVRDAEKAVAPLGLEPVTVDELPGPWWAEKAALDAIDAARARAVVAFLPFEDNLVHLRGGPAPLIDPAHHGLELPAWGSDKPGPLGAARHVFARTFVADGKIAGVWELEPASGRVVTAGFAPLPPATQRRVDEAAERAAAFLAGLGHGRSFSLDTDEELTKRAARVRALAAKPKPKPRARPAASARR